MRSIWRTYPHTVREQSETEELCRLLLPTAWLYYATGKAEDKALLYTLVHDLEKMRHPSGGYLEWDSDYSAACSRQDGGECSLLSRNGDPVVDLLYSNNWVPLGLMQAYFVTGDGILPPVLPPCRLFAALPDTQRRPEAGRRVGARL